MAERRMFSKSVVQTGRFLRLPAAARLLYYDLSMSADDDGVAEGLLVLRSTGASEADLRALEAQGYISVLNDDLVCHITDWKRNNLIRKDRYRAGAYRDLLPDGAGDPEGGQADAGPAADRGRGDAEPSTDCQPNDAERLTQVRSGKDRSGKASTGERAPCREPGKTAPRFSPPSPEEVRAYCQQRKNGVDPQRFMDFYASKGWRVGREPMRDWRAAVRTWESRDRQPNPARAGPGGGVTAMPAGEEYEKGWEDYYA